jgi:hypothetical protein
MKRKTVFVIVSGFAFMTLSVLIFSCKTASKQQSRSNPDSVNYTKSHADLLGIIYSLADKKGMKVISDIGTPAGAWYGKISAEKMADSMRRYIDHYNARYGSHKSFWGWYLNHEINPLKPGETAPSVFWRTVWKAAVEECHKVKPESVVTISPFFLLDKDALRGFEYLQPVVYEKWWTETLKETGIDILMLQDSGAGHLSFFSLDERKPFLAAFANACKQAGCKFWVNVETGQVDAKNWPDAITMERNRQKKWVFTPIDWLEQKLELASEYGEGIINWGYFPLMNPVKDDGPWPAGEVDGQLISFAGQKKAYEDYLAYYKKVPKKISGNAKCRPIIRGTLWMLQMNYTGWSEKKLRDVLTQQIDAQKAAGFDVLWITNTAKNMEWAEK